MNIRESDFWPTSFSIYEATAPSVWIGSEFADSAITQKEPEPQVAPVHRHLLIGVARVIACVGAASLLASI